MTLGKSRFAKLKLFLLVMADGALYIRTESTEVNEPKEQPNSFKGKNANALPSALDQAGF